MKQIYLDYAATTPVDPRVLDKMLPFFHKTFGNPSGIHHFSRIAKKELDNAREKTANILNCSAQEIIFTGSGTESDNLAIFGTVSANSSQQKNHLITSSIEHHAVLHPMQKLAAQKHQTDFIKPDNNGLIDPHYFKKIINNHTLFSSIIYANNEIGTINDIQNLAEIAKEKEIIFHTDACQAAGALELDTKKLNIDLMTLNGSKIYGPKGVGLLYKKKKLKINPLILGGHQEWNLRAGTENLANIVGFAEALYLAQQEKDYQYRHLSKLRDKIIDFVLKEIPLSRLNGHPTKRLPGNAHFSFLNTEGESLLLYLDNIGFAAATGSACTSDSLEPSHVLTGIGMPKEIAHGSLRFTLGKYTQESDIDKLLLNLPKIIEQVRKMSPVQFNAADFPKWFI